MYTYTLQHDNGVTLKVAEGYKPVALTTASGTLNGTAVDRAPTASTASDVVADTYNWMKVIVPLSASIGTAVTSSVTVKVQDADSSTGIFADYAFKDGSTVGTVSVGSTASTAAQSALHAVSSFDVDLHAAKRYVRVVLGEALTTATTVTATGVVSATVLFGGAVNYPVA